MIIKKIVLNNFRIYYGINELNFSTDEIRNISVIAGNNGFGKTSLLTSLVWGLYGKLMADVDDRYRKEIYESGGYRKYCERTMNWRATEESNSSVHQLTDRRSKVNAIDKRQIDKEISELQSFSVSIQFGNIFIPSVQCDELIVKRSYNTQTHHEAVEILIDGRPNELTKGMGENIFINDFILPKEIAKFFFFDAEKIVSLAEIKTAEEKKALSYAYAEVLGIKKYADLKENLENMQFRLRTKSSNKEDRVKFEKLKKSLKQQEKIMTHNKSVIAEKKEELAIKKAAADKFQEQLIREGTSLSVEDVKDFKKIRDELSEESKKIRTRLQEMMELAPFAIAAGKLKKVKEQSEEEQAEANKHLSGKLLEKKSKAIAQDLKKHKKTLSLNKEKEKILLDIIQQHLHDDTKKEFTILLNFSTEQYNRCYALHANISGSFNKAFRQIISDLKKQQSSLQIIKRKLQDAESKENDPVIKRVRQDKTKLEESIRQLEEEIIQIEAEKLHSQHEWNSTSKVLKELSKSIGVEDRDKVKDETAERLIGELTDFVRRLKIKKKSSLESNIQAELNRLMHKTNFVNRAEVIIEGDMINIELYDKKNQLINKDELSKGEQQLYATALLKALIEESNIQFPVFIDSPLQKFDKEHSRNIIRDFYPKVSAQVILLPLLEKELTEPEYKWLLPHIASAYLIENKEEFISAFIPVRPAKLFDIFRQESQHVYEH